MGVKLLVLYHLPSQGQWVASLLCWHGGFLLAFPFFISSSHGVSSIFLVIKTVILPLWCMDSFIFYKLVWCPESPSFVFIWKFFSRHCMHAYMCVHMYVCEFCMPAHMEKLENNSAPKTGLSLQSCSPHLFTRVLETLLAWPHLCGPHLFAAPHLTSIVLHCF